MKKLLPRIIGQRYEAKAEKYLRQQGLSSLARNYQCRFGEIDLIMTQNHVLIFIEVRARNTTAFGRAIETVAQNKQQKIIRTSQYFLQQHPRVSYNAIRYDVVGIQTTSPHIEWVQNAFVVHDDTWI